MKRTLLLIALIVSTFISYEANAQVGVSINIGVQPVWGPVGYEHADYYYLPDVDAYYDIPNRVFVYQDAGVWVRRPALPPRFASYDLYHGYKVVVNAPEPWLHHEVYYNKYISYRGRHDQIVIRDSREPRYYEIKEHPMHSQWHPENHPVNHVENHQENHNQGQHNQGNHNQGRH